MRTRDLNILSLGIVLISTIGAFAAVTCEDFSPGTQIQLTGTNPGTPPQRYYWTKNGEVLDDSAYIFGTDTLTLTLNNCVPEDTAEYNVYAGGLANLVSNFCVRVQTPEKRMHVNLTDPIVLEGSTNAYEYEWFKDDGLRPDLQSYSYSLTIPNAKEIDSGTYWLMVKGRPDPVMNVMYIVDVSVPGTAPTISNFFLKTSGDHITFTVEATGSRPLAYQWFWQGQLIPGATSSVLDYTNAYSTANAGYYQVEVSNMYGAASNPPPGLLFLKPTPGGKYQGLFFEEPTPKVSSSGRFEFNLTSSKKKAFSGKATILDQVYKFSGAFSDAHYTEVTATAKTGSTPLTLKMQLLTTNQTAFLQGRVSNGTWTSPLRGYLSDFSTNAPPVGSGQYTVALMRNGTNAPGEVPDGVSIGSAEMRMSGRVDMAGKMADGTPYSCSSFLSPTGEWPVYVPLNGNRGCLVGWVQTGSTTNTRSTDSLPMFWMKEPVPGTYYPKGFKLSLQPLVSRYDKGVAALPLEESVAAFAFGDLFQPELAVWTFVKVAQPEPNQLVPEKSTENLQLGVGSSKGFINGKFTDFTTGLRTPIRGVVLQDFGLALGYFLSTNSSGYFSLSANAPGE